MEYMDGQSLSDFLNKVNPSSLQVSFVYRIGIQILRAISFLHDHYIIHQDITPKNILFDKNFKQVKLKGFEKSVKRKQEREMKQK